MWRSKNLDDLNDGGWGVFIASNHFLAVGWLCCRRAHRLVRWCTGHGIVHCPVSATSANRWVWSCWPLKSFVLLRHRTVGGTPDSPVYSDFAVLTSDFCTVHCSFVSAVDHWRSWPLLRWLNGQSGVHRTIRWIIAEWLWEKPESGQFARCLCLGTGQCSVRH
jgi:hypothetical protein